MSLIIEMRVCKFAQEHDRWQVTIDKRAALGRGLTNTQTRSFEVWKSNLVQKLVFNKKRQTLIGEAKQVNKDCIAVELSLSDDPEQLLLSSCAAIANPKQFRLLLLKKSTQVIPHTLPSVLDNPAKKTAIVCEDDEGEENEESENAEDQEQHESEHDLRTLEDERFRAQHPEMCDDDENDDFVMLADSDDEPFEIPSIPKVSKVKSFHRREAWQHLEAKGLTELPRHIVGCSIGYHQTSQQWQGFYPCATHILSSSWGGKTNRTEHESLLRVIRGILECHVGACPKEKLWDRQLQKVKHAEATSVFP